MFTNDQNASMSASKSVSRSDQAHTMSKEENKTHKPIDIIDLDDSDIVENNNEKIDCNEEEASRENIRRE